MEQRLLKTFRFNNGFFNTDEFAYPSDCLAPGSKNLLILGQDSLKAFKGMTEDAGKLGSRLMFVTSNGYAGLADVGATQGKGSVFNFIGESLWFSGQGKVLLNGADSGFAATNLLQVAPKVSGTYPQAYVAGLNAPAAPNVTAGSSGILKGVYSFKISGVRSATGAVSNASLTSNIIELDNQKAVLQFPVKTQTGDDRWQIFATKAGFGGVGIHYLVREIGESDLSTIGGISRAYELDFSDSDLLEVIAPTRNFPPPSAPFSATLEAYTLIIGCYDNAIACSGGNYPESFDPEQLLYLPKKPTAVLASPIGSFLYVATNSSVHAISVTGGEFPLTIQTVWSQVGILSHHNWCEVEGVLFAYVAQQGATTMNQFGQPDNTFALPVAKEFANWQPEDTFVFYDPNISTVIYANRAEQKCVGFNLQNRKWHSPCEMAEFLTGQIISGVVVDRQLKMSVQNGNNFKVFDWNKGTGDVEICAATPFFTNALSGRLNVYGASVVAKTAGEITLELFSNNKSIADKTFSVPNSGAVNFSAKQRVFLPRCNSIAARLTSIANSNEEAYPIAVNIFGTPEREAAQ